MYFTLTIEKGRNSHMAFAIRILNHHFELNSTSLLHGWCNAQKLSLAGQVGPRLSHTVKHTADVLMWWVYAQARYHYRSTSKHMPHTRRQEQRGCKGTNSIQVQVYTPMDELPITANHSLYIKCLAPITLIACVYTWMTN